MSELVQRIQSTILGRNQTSIPDDNRVGFNYQPVISPKMPEEGRMPLMLFERFLFDIKSKRKHSQQKC